MPIYEFECKGCSTRFEKLCSISAGEGGVECPQCGGQKTRRLISSFYSHSKGGSSGGHAPASSHSCGGCHKSSCSGCH